MGDKRRFDLFSKLIEKHLDKNMKIVDVACGKGYLQAALLQKGFKNVISWDKRKKTAKNRRGYRYGYFDWRIKEKYDAVVAMHPDEGTDHSILYAVKNRVPALVCPCCIKWDAKVYWGDGSNFNNWVNHLIRIAENMTVEKQWLRMNGRNLVLIIKPNTLEFAIG